MKQVSSVTLGIALLVAMSDMLVAQEIPGRNLSAKIFVRGVTFAGDTTTITFMLLNESTSLEKLESFAVHADSNAVPIEVISPGSPRAWRATNRFRDRTVAHWVSFGGIAPGDTMPWLTYRARGLPYPTVAWYRGDSLMSSFDYDTTGYDPLENQDPDPIADLSVQTWTVGIEKVPSWATTVPGLTVRLADFTRGVCSFGVITRKDVCDTLLGHLRALPSRVQGFTASLDSAYTGRSTVPNAAYFLLKPNAMYLMSFVDPEGVALDYVCGNKFRIRNTSYATVTATYSVASTAETGPATLPGRDDSVEFSETFITTINAGTFRLHYGGNIVLSAANGAVPC